jgi:hypothetical protein
MAGIPAHAGGDELVGVRADIADCTVSLRAEPDGTFTFRLDPPEGLPLRIVSGRVDRCNAKDQHSTLRLTAKELRQADCSTWRVTDDT